MERNAVCSGPEYSKGLRVTTIGDPEDKVRSKAEFIKHQRIKIERERERERENGERVKEKLDAFPSSVL